MISLSRLVIFKPGRGLPRSGPFALLAITA